MKTEGAFPREELKTAVQTLAALGIFVGTSSWKYEGWLGMIYTEDRYRTRGKFSKAKFEKSCLFEYAKVFKTVCLDAGFYQFPGAKMLEGIFSQVPIDFRLSIKVTEDITVKKFPNLPRYGRRAGQTNEHFLDADLFIASFLGSLQQYRERVGTLIFEFGHFHAGDWERGRQFVEALDSFFSRLPKGWNYSVEIRNETFLQASAPKDEEELLIGVPCLRFSPPVPANIIVNDARPAFLYSSRSTGPIRDARGPWLQDGDWWEKRNWSREEWDIATDDGLYRLVHSAEEWFLDGIYA